MTQPRSAQRRLTLFWLVLTLAIATARSAHASVTLTAFTATGSSDRITLAWVTASELDTFGFYVWRTTVAAATFAGIPADQRARVNVQPVAAVGDVTGAAYTLDDTAVMTDVTYFYWLEDVDNYGLSTFHGAPSARLTATGQIGRPPTVTAAPTATAPATPSATEPVTVAATPSATSTPSATTPMSTVPTAAVVLSPTVPPTVTGGQPVAGAVVVATISPTRARRTIAAPTATATMARVGVGEDSAESPRPTAIDPTVAATGAAPPVAVAVIGASATARPPRPVAAPATSAPARADSWLMLAAAVVTLGSAALIGAAVLRRRRSSARGNGSYGDD